MEIDVEGDRRGGRDADLVVGADVQLRFFLLEEVSTLSDTVGGVVSTQTSNGVLRLLV